MAAMTVRMAVPRRQQRFTQSGSSCWSDWHAKNAILIVEFARELEFRGRSPVQAVAEAARLRCDPSS
jgi:multidrug efflux pump